MCQVEPMVSHLAPLLLRWVVDGVDHGRRANDHEEFAPQGVYPCDGEEQWVAITVRSDAQWMSLLEALGVPVSQTDPRWGESAARREDRHRIDEVVSARTRHFNREAIVERLRDHGIAVSPVNSAAEVVADDLQLAAREHWTRLDHPEMGYTIYNRVPFRYSSYDTAPQRPAPLIGEHTEEVLSELLGMGRSEILRLSEEGVLH
jgi:benzylsuccinate CoA-transferase BbsF subunit